MYAVFLIWNVSSSHRLALSKLRRCIAKDERKQHKTAQSLRSDSTPARREHSAREYQSES